MKIKDTFQLQNYPDAFAIGDIIDVKEQKQAAKAQTHAALVAANVLSFIAGQPPKKKYTGSPELILVTNGKVRHSRFLVALVGLNELFRLAVLGISVCCGVSRWVVI